MDKEDYDYLWICRDNSSLPDDPAVLQLDKLFAENNENEKILWHRLTLLARLDSSKIITVYLAAQAEDDNDAKLRVLFTYYDKLAPSGVTRRMERILKAEGKRQREAEVRTATRGTTRRGEKARRRTTTI
eukprot:5614602-Amphidinium_carterae.3